MSGTYTYDSLAKKYDNFTTPVVKVKAGGSDVVSTLNLAVVEFKMTLSLDAASIVVVKFTDVYDIEQHSFSSDVKDAFAPGTVVEVEIGYKSSTENLFKGFVAARGIEIGKMPLFVVTLMDARRLMMLSGSRYVLHVAKNYSDVFREVMSRYSKLCSPQIDATQDELEIPVSQTTDDYRFVTRELIGRGKAEREFFILGPTAYFREPQSEKSAIMTMEFGRELIALKTDESYFDVSVEVVGYDPAKQEALSGKAEATGSDSQTKLIGETPEYYMPDPSVDTSAKANSKAKSLADRMKRKMQTGTGMTIGLPVLVPGRFVEVENADGDLGDHTFYLKTVIHEISKDNYRTMFEIGGWS
ncbi:MAG: phage late control D family protein [Lachnospiraceae bacterium]|nr:phage late control D family protein [Lachnospiraceae bacterium]